GTLITRTISYYYPDQCKATHINGVPNSPPPLTRNPITALENAITPYTEGEEAGNERRAWFMTKGIGYSSLQATKPQTSGDGLTYSPVGLLAWIYEKLHDWTDSHPFIDHAILTRVCIYLFARARVKLGLVHFLKDLLAPPPR
ncbi:MAG: hypothetical protein Q9183_004927, partial [Haloplaca sp. 2 TL-2023]